MVPYLDLQYPLHKIFIEVRFKCRKPYIKKLMIRIKPICWYFRFPLKVTQIFPTDRYHCLSHVLQLFSTFVNLLTYCNLLTCHNFFLREWRYFFPQKGQHNEFPLTLSRKPIVSRHRPRTQFSIQSLKRFLQVRSSNLYQRQHIQVQDNHSH